MSENQAPDVCWVPKIGVLFGNLHPIALHLSNFSPSISFIILASFNETFRCYEISPRRENSLLIKRQFSLALDGIIHLYLSKAIKIRDVNCVCYSAHCLVPLEVFDQIKQSIELNSDLIK